MTSTQKHYARSSFSEGFTKLGISILQTAKQPERIFQSGRYFGIPGHTKLQKDVIESILDTPKVQELLAKRPSPQWPALEQMAAMPKGSLGWCVHRRLERLGISFLIDQSQIHKSQTDEEFAKPEMLGCMTFTSRFSAYRSQWLVKRLQQHLMRAPDQPPLILAFLHHGCCMVFTNPVSAG